MTTPCDRLSAPPALFDCAPISYPSTRYQGSKAKLIPWLTERLADLQYDSVLDAFGGSASASLMFKALGKEVTYNDLLQANQQIGLALVANPGKRLAHSRLESILRAAEGEPCGRGFISTVYAGIFYTDVENQWLDQVIPAIMAQDDPVERAMLFYCLFQSCIIKRPYNLFHRANLYMRLQDVKRTFGNKTSWDRAFPEHMRDFATELNRCVFSNGRQNRALCNDALQLPTDFDLVYLDPPYMKANGQSVDYVDFYHFLDGIANYPNWNGRVDFGKKHRPLLHAPSPWCNQNTIVDVFRKTLLRFRDSILVISYRSDGLPSPHDIENWLRELNKDVTVYTNDRFKYALSHDEKGKELLFVAS